MNFIYNLIVLSICTLVSCERSTMSMRSQQIRGIDAHLHIWSDGKAPYVYIPEDNAPPSHLVEVGQPGNLVELMNEAGIDGALIVQPINHKYDHSFVLNCLKNEQYGSKFKGMCLLDPLCDDEYLPTLRRQGFCSVRFNPYLFPEEDDKGMNSDRGKELFKQCAELSMPVGFMLFKGIPRHVVEVEELLEYEPNTAVIIDHFGFFVQKGEVNEEAFNKLLEWGTKYPQLHVKISAFFRNVVSKDFPYMELKDRFFALKEAFGADRLLFGSDFPYVVDECKYADTVQAVKAWGVQDQDMEWLMRGTAEKLFGEW